MFPLIRPPFDIFPTFTSYCLLKYPKNSKFDLYNLFSLECVKNNEFNNYFTETHKRRYLQFLMHWLVYWGIKAYLRQFRRKPQKTHNG